MSKYWLFIVLIIGTLSCRDANLEEVENRDENGQLTEKFSRRKDTFAKQGLYQAFFPNGKVMIEAQYENDTLHGVRKMLYENGKTQLIERYEKGRFVGTYEAFYENGQLEITGEFVDNEMTGPWKRYYDTGELMEVVLFKHNEENGPFTEYHKNGNVKTEGEYLNGDNEHGILKKYDEAGELAARMFCHFGICKTIWTIKDENIKFDEKEFKAMVERMKAIENPEKSPDL